jgi:penicillin-binding protein 1B
MARSSSPSRRSLGLRLAARVVLFALGLAIGLLGPSVWWLDREAGRRFAERQWSQASRVYARPLELFSGRRITREALMIELEAAGLRPGPAGTIGRYSAAGPTLDLHVPGFTFPDQTQTPQRVRLKLADGRITALSGPGDSEVELVRLPPAELGSLMPLDDRDRTLVALADFPPLLVTGIQAVEDRNFKHHHGIDPRGLLRAAWVNLRHGEIVQGGSTITQQLVKNLFLSAERRWVRKFNEAIMALSLERRFSKAEILEAYLNEVYLGQDGAHAIHGFGRAAEYYFDLPVQALSVEQIALLIGMARGASWYHPVRNAERARDRRDRVLAMFLETGLIDRSAFEAARARSLGVRPSSPGRSRRHGQFLDLVSRQLRRDYRDRDLRNAGLRIFTTLEPAAQRAAERALQQGLDEVEREDGELQGAIVLVEPASGEIRALVGDRQPGRSGFNRALDARRSVGSVIKPFVYLPALARPERYSLVTPLLDAALSVPIDGQEPWQPRNHDGQSHGRVPLMTALARSHNQATVRLGLELGLPALFRLLRQLGVEPGSEQHPSALLGALSLTPFQVAQLYQALAAEGYSAPLRAINEVVDAGGQSIARYPTRLRPIRDRGALALLDHALRFAVTDGTARSLSWRLTDDPGVRGKTGTTNERRDAWFVGYTRDWLGVVWTGRDDYAPAGISGAGTALPVWAKLFSALPVRPVRPSWPEDIEWYWIDWPEPMLADDQCSRARAVPFIAGSQPDALSPCLQPGGRSRRR